MPYICVMYIRKQVLVCQVCYIALYMCPIYAYVCVIYTRKQVLMCEACCIALYMCPTYAYICVLHMPIYVSCIHVSRCSCARHAVLPSPTKAPPSSRQHLSISLLSISLIALSLSLSLSPSPSYSFSHSLSHHLALSRFLSPRWLMCIDIPHIKHTSVCMLTVEIHSQPCLPLSYRTYKDI